MIHDFGLLNGINKVPAVQESLKEAIRKINEALK
jgi:hypothetical protein